MNKQWKIVQVRVDRFTIYYRSRFWPFWFDHSTHASLKVAQTAMEREIMHEHTYPRVVDQVTDEVGYVRARLKGTE